MMRKAVAGQKALQANDAGRVRRSDQHRAADAGLDQAYPAKDQRAHDALAEIGFGDQQRAQLLRRNQERFDVALGMAIDQRGAAGELADFGQKLTGSLVDHRRDVTEAVALADRDMTGQDDEHSRTRLAGFEQSFAVLVASHFAEAAHPRNLLRRQRRERLLEARKPGRQRCSGIGFISSRAVHTHLRLASSKASKNLPRVEPGYLPGFFPPTSYGETSSGLGGTVVTSPRPRACDFRRLRFSRDASFSRSCRGFFPRSPLCPWTLAFASFIVDLFERAGEKPMGEIPAL